MVEESLEVVVAKGDRGVAIDQQSQHHGERVLGVAGALLVGPRPAQNQRAYRVHDEVNQVIRSHPVAMVRRQEHRGVVVNVDEADGHSPYTTSPAGFVRWLWLSPIGCEVKS